MCDVMAVLILEKNLFIHSELKLWKAICGLNLWRVLDIFSFSLRLLLYYFINLQISVNLVMCMCRFILRLLVCRLEF
jgi:hypothetical protein